MDSITHIALGGLIGETFAGKQLGKRATIVGAAAQSIPDIDFVASAWLDASSNVLAHRGFTHSFLFVVLLTPLLAWAARRWFGTQAISLQKWILFFGVQMSVHLLLDSLNAYGVGWFEPFSHQRLSLNVMFVADPFYSFWLGAAFIGLLLLNKKNSYRIAWASSGLLFSSAYIVYALLNKHSVDDSAKENFYAQGMEPNRYFTTPTPLNNWLWFIVAEDKKGFYVGYRSVFDGRDPISFQYFPRNDSLIRPISDREDLKKLRRFSQGYYTAERQNDTLVFNDLRFGQRAGWHDPKAKFVFRYIIEPPSENLMILQSGRFAGWNKASMESFYEKVKGR
jgi:inner membrane protein